MVYYDLSSIAVRDSLRVQRQAMATSLKNKLNKWQDCLVDYVPKSIKNAVGKAFLRAKNRILGLHDGVKKTLKGDVENQKQAKDNTNLTRDENEGEIYYRKIELPF